MASGEGYVPQVTVAGANQSVLCCTAEADGAPGNLPFQTYLLNWTAAKERTGEEGSSGDSASGDGADKFVDLTAAEKDAIYRKACVYFDDCLDGVDPTNKATRLLARAKQYIHNHATQEEGDFRSSTAGRARAATRKKDVQKAGGLAKLQGAQLAGAEPAAPAAPTKITGSVLAAGGAGPPSVPAPPAAAQSDEAWEAKQAAAAHEAKQAGSAADVSELVFEAPADESGLEALANVFD